MFTWLSLFKNLFGENVWLKKFNFQAMFRILCIDLPIEILKIIKYNQVNKREAGYIINER